MTQAAYCVRAVIMCHTISRLMTLTGKKKEKKTAATTKTDSVAFNHSTDEYIINSKLHEHICDNLACAMMFYIFNRMKIPMKW